MSEKYFEEDVLGMLNNLDCEMDAEELLKKHFPKVPARVKRAIGNLNKILEEVRTVFPDANYYLEDTANFNLMLGSSHSDGFGDRGCRAQQELVAHHSSLWNASGGGW